MATVLTGAVYMARGDMVIRDALPNDWPYIQWLTRQESYALGWLPRQWFDRVWGLHPKAFRAWILLCEVNRDAVGYCAVSPAFKPPYYGRIYQMAVQADARRHEYGTFLADVAHRLVIQNGGNGTTLRCASELPANQFWDALGFHLIDVIPVGASVGDSPRVVRRQLDKRMKPALHGGMQSLLHHSVA